MDDHAAIDSSVDFELAALRLHLVVGMAAADDEIHDEEITGLAELVQQCDVTPPQRRYLDQLLLALVANPPKLEDLLRRLIETIEDPSLAQLLVDDLVAIAQSDGRIDPREEGMLRLVCGALEIDPVSLYEPHERAAGDASAADLARLVRSLLDLDMAA
ncbi:MAG: TerB family tellurite resistance protein [Thermoleophilia bacterium]|nr:TerB family tellurite resistance protein [Thermoleophilia bacterium]